MVITKNVPYKAFRRSIRPGNKVGTLLFLDLNTKLILN
jgi:hypothetical protein